MEYLNHIVVLGGLVVVLVQQILKLKLVPVGFANKYPVPTLIGLSIIGSIAIVAKTGVNAHTWGDWVQLFATIALIASFTYNNTFRNWKELRDIEGTPSGK